MCLISRGREFKSGNSSGNIASVSLFSRLGGGPVNTYKMQRVADKVNEIRAASKDGWWNGNREVEVRHSVRVSLYTTAMPPPRDGRGKEQTE